jgi:hypothetical protein
LDVVFRTAPAAVCAVTPPVSRPGKLEVERRACQQLTMTGV